MSSKIVRISGMTIAFSLGVLSLVLIPTAANAAPITVSQCNNTTSDDDPIDENIGGRGVTCDIIVTNNIDMATGVTSSTVVTHNCNGFANTALVCIDNTVTTSDLVTAVEQCNTTTNGGGGVLECSVIIINNITGVDIPTIATVNQCIGSGEGSGAINTLVCDPIQSTTNAAITQCNGTGNGDGAPDRVICTVFESTSSAVVPVTVNQCNGSSNGGGAFATCEVTMTNNIIAPPDDGDGDGDGGTGGDGDGGNGVGGGIDNPNGGGDNPTGGVPGDGTGNGNGGTAGVDGESLAATGTDDVAIAAFSASALLIGIALLLVVRRRESKMTPA